MNLSKARRSNPRYARLLGWGSRYPQVAELLGFRSSSPSPDQFAFAVADWQRAHPPLTPDGMIGSRTWHAMEPETRFNAGPGLPPVWMVATPVVEDEGPPVVVPRPSIEAVQMASGRRRHRAYDAAFSDREMESHHYYMEMLSAAQTLGRMHATAMRMAADPPPEAVAGRRPPPRGAGLATTDEEWEQFDEAVEAGYLVRDGRRFRSVLPQMQEFRDLEAWYGMAFIDEFNFAVRDQWQYLEEADIADALSLIAEFLVGWGISAVARRTAVAAAARSAGSAALERLASLCRRVLTKCRAFVSRLAARIRSIVNRITGGGRPQISLCSRSGQTLPGMGDPPLNIGDAATNPSATFERVTARQHQLPPQPSQGVTGTNGVQAVELSMADAIDMAFVGEYPRSSLTWGSSPVMVESYAAKWAAHGLPGTPPPYGFRVFRNGTLVEIVAHVPENPLRMAGRIGRAASR